MNHFHGRPSVSWLRSLRQAVVIAVFFDLTSKRLDVFRYDCENPSQGLVKAVSYLLAGRKSPTDRRHFYPKPKTLPILDRIRELGTISFVTFIGDEAAHSALTANIF
jgi:hypothetical protein